MGGLQSRVLTEKRTMRMKGKCDAEIGKPGRGWHICGRPVVVGVYIGGMSLYFCSRHADRAEYYRQQGGKIVAMGAKERCATRL